MDFTWDFICTGEILEGNFMLGWHQMILASGFHSLEEILQQMAEVEGKPVHVFDNCIVCVIWEKRLCTQDIWHAKELDLLTTLCPAVWNVFWLETTSVTTYSQWEHNTDLRHNISKQSFSPSYSSLSFFPHCKSVYRQLGLQAFCKVLFLKGINPFTG